MNIKIIAVGNLKEKFWQAASDEYVKRMRPYCGIQIKEIKESPLRANPSPADEEAVKDAEGDSVLNAIRTSDYVITLEINGRSLSSEQLASKIEDLGISGKSSVVFVIGGSLGLSQKVCRRADFRLSFSSMTFPHQMMRVILLEQIYRSFKIMRNEPYHK